MALDTKELSDIVSDINPKKIDGDFDFAGKKNYVDQIAMIVELLKNGDNLRDIRFSGVDLYICMKAFSIFKDIEYDRISRIFPEEYNKLVMIDLFMNQTLSKQ